MRCLLLPIERLLLQKGDKSLILAVLQSVPLGDNSHGYKPTHAFFEALVRKGDTDILRVLYNRVCRYDEFNILFALACGSKDTKQVYSLLRKNRFSVLNLRQLRALLDLHDERCNSLYFGRWLCYILQDGGYYGEREYLEEAGILREIKDRYLKK